MSAHPPSPLIAFEAKEGVPRALERIGRETVRETETDRVELSSARSKGHLEVPCADDPGSLQNDASCPEHRTGIPHSVRAEVLQPVDQLYVHVAQIDIDVRAESWTQIFAFQAGSGRLIECQSERFEILLPNVHTRGLPVPTEPLQVLGTLGERIVQVEARYRAGTASRAILAEGNHNHRPVDSFDDP